MSQLCPWKKVVVMMVACLGVAIAANAQTFQTMFSFNGSNGAYPGALVQGIDGNFYGNTLEGGPNPSESAGTLFRITPGGQWTMTYAFCQQNPDCPDGSIVHTLVLGTDLYFYGMTELGGNAPYCLLPYLCGTVFKVTPAGHLTTIYNFCSQSNCTDGFEPEDPLIQGADGNFYGTTSGAASLGNVFQMTASGEQKTIHLFVNANRGAEPYGALVQASDGSFYGTTSEGGNTCEPISCGTVFRVTASGQFKIMHFFQGSDGSYILAGLLEASDGNFYGATYFGGDLTCEAPSGCGTIFRMTPEGKFTTLHTFEMTDGAYPSAGLIQATDGNLYGTTESGGTNANGTIFKIDLLGNLTTLHNFNGTDGSLTQTTLLQATSGTIYGTSRGGDMSCSYGCGNIFSLDVGLGPFVTFVHRTGRVGQTIEILGQGFTGTTSVLLNGIPATFTVRSDTFLTATVPSDATTGIVTVTTPTGTLNSNVPFSVLP